MSDDKRPGRGGGCTTILGCLGVVAVGGYVAVRGAVVWLDRHPLMVWTVVGMAAFGAGVGIGLSAWRDYRSARRPPDA